MPVQELIEIAVRVDGKKLGLETLAYYKALLQEEYNKIKEATELEDAFNYNAGGSL